MIFILFGFVLELLLKIVWCHHDIFMKQILFTEHISSYILNMQNSKLISLVTYIYK